ncbi:MAG: hypothetical protein WA581_15175 [Candidatus Acidiferrales bacterium]
MNNEAPSSAALTGELAASATKVRVIVTPNVTTTERARKNEAFLVELESEQIGVEAFRLCSIRPPMACQHGDFAELPEYFAPARRGLPTEIKAKKAGEHVAVRSKAT